LLEIGVMTVFAGELSPGKKSLLRLVVLHLAEREHSPADVHPRQTDPFDSTIIFSLLCRLRIPFSHQIQINTHHAIQYSRGRGEKPQRFTDPGVLC